MPIADWAERFTLGLFCLNQQSAPQTSTLTLSYAEGAAIHNQQLYD
jgi:hypothetical protein